jgi:hypothetical protein
MVTFALSFSLTYDHKDTDYGQIVHTPASYAISYSFLLSWTNIQLHAYGFLPASVNFYLQCKETRGPEQHKLYSD